MGLCRPGMRDCALDHEQNWAARLTPGCKYQHPGIAIQCRKWPVLWGVCTEPGPRTSFLPRCCCSMRWDNAAFGSQLPSAFRAPVVGCGQEIWQLFSPLRKCWLVEPKFCLKKQSFSWKTVWKRWKWEGNKPSVSSSTIKCPDQWSIHKLFWYPFYWQHMSDSFSWVENKIKFLLLKSLPDCENTFQSSFDWI